MAASKRPAVQLLTIPEAAGRLGKVSENHVRRLIASGELASIDISQRGARQSKTRVPEDALGEFIESRRRVAPRRGLRTA